MSDAPLFHMSTFMSDKNVPCSPRNNGIISALWLHYFITKHIMCLYLHFNSNYNFLEERFIFMITFFFFSFKKYHQVL